MIFSQDRSELRRLWMDAWQKRLAGTPTSPLEAQIADVIELHPEYQAAVTADDIDRDYTSEERAVNPFLHMGLHLAIREQVATDRPGGIAAVYQSLLARHGDLHAAEHAMIDVLGETLWVAQSKNCAPDEQQYLEKLKRL